MTDATTRLTVRTAAPYDVLIGSGVIDAVGQLLGGARQVAVVHPEALASLGSALRERLSARGYDRVLRVAWTIADLAGRTTPSISDVHQAVQLRAGGPQ